jgi:nucleoside-diphosphate-sugar epimerase
VNANPALSISDKIVLFGGAGLVGQNLVILMKSQGFTNLVVIDKHAANVAVQRRLHPDLKIIEADLAESGSWEQELAGAAAAVMLQAQIGSEVEDDFERNNVRSTECALAACRRHALPYLVHISSSVVNSLARDWYTESKKAQERIVRASRQPHCVLRPTLMFGWFDRKHLGWLSRFMLKVPVFPIPGSGRYLRQPLYAMDFCRVILACLQQQPIGEVYDISGAEKIDYIDLILAIRTAIRSRTWVIRIPYWLFWLLLRVWAVFDRHPPFTTQQLKALVTPDEFDLIPWGQMFGTPPTPLARALDETFNGEYSDVVLEF